MGPSADGHEASASSGPQALSWELELQLLWLQLQQLQVDLGRLWQLGLG